MPSCPPPLRWEQTTFYCRQSPSESQTLNAFNTLPPIQCKKETVRRTVTSSVVKLWHFLWDGRPLLSATDTNARCYEAQMRLRWVAPHTTDKKTGFTTERLLCQWHVRALSFRSWEEAIMFVRRKRRPEGCRHRRRKRNWNEKFGGLISCHDEDGSHSRQIYNMHIHGHWPDNYVGMRTHTVKRLERCPVFGARLLMRFRFVVCYFRRTE